MNNTNKHLFAIYTPGLSAGPSSFDVGASFLYKNELLWQRIVRVLRLRTGETVTLFDSLISINVVINSNTFSDKKQANITGTIIALSKNSLLLPEIIFYPCITKKDTFETIIYAAAQLGVSKIVPVVSEKVQRELAGPKEIERLHKIMVAACEQARQFVIPELCSPIKLAQIPEDNGDAQKTHKICFECEGAPLGELAQKLSLAQDKQETKICVVQGPEGGLMDQEVSFLRAQKFDIYSLTPTILRSQDAVLVGLGFLRSII